MKEATGLRGTGEEGVEAMSVEAMNVGVMIVVASTEVEEEVVRPPVWGKSESLPSPSSPNRYHYLVLLDGSAQIFI